MPGPGCRTEAASDDSPGGLLAGPPTARSSLEGGGAGVPGGDGRTPSGGSGSRPVESCSGNTGASTCPPNSSCPPSSGPSGSTDSGGSERGAAGAGGCGVPGGGVTIGNPPARRSSAMPPGAGRGGCSGADGRAEPGRPGAGDCGSDAGIGPLTVVSGPAERSVVLAVPPVADPAFGIAPAKPNGRFGVLPLVSESGAAEYASVLSTAPTCPAPTFPPGGVRSPDNDVTSSPRGGVSGRLAVTGGGADADPAERCRWSSSKRPGNCSRRSHSANGCASAANAPNSAVRSTRAGPRGPCQESARPGGVPGCGADVTIPPGCSVLSGRWHPAVVCGEFDGTNTEASARMSCPPHAARPFAFGLLPTKDSSSCPSPVPVFR